MKNQLGENIKLKRTSRALSTGTVAEAAGVSESAVKAWEDDRSMPSPAQLEKLCTVFDCRLTQLVFGQDEADVDAMLMQLIKRLYSLRALLTAAAGALLILLPAGPQYTASTNLGLFFTGLLSGIHIGCTIVGVFVLFYGISLFLRGRK